MHKSDQKLENLGTAALVLSAILGSFASYASKIALRELTPTMILFLRISFMVLSLSPVIVKNRRLLAANWKRLALIGLLWAGNIGGFIIGIKLTTAIAAAVIYTAVPLVVMILERVILKARSTKLQKLGVTVGLIGALLVILQKTDSTVIGSLRGNLIIASAITSYSLYLVTSKKFSQHLSPASLLSGSALTGWLVSLLLLIFIDGPKSAKIITSASASTWLAVVFLGIFLGGFMYWLIQWGVKHSTPLAAGMMGYLGLVVTSSIGYFWLGERLTLQTALGCLLVIAGVGLTSLWPLVVTKNSKRV